MYSVQIYKLVLNGTLKCFPRYFWVGDEGRNHAKECVKYLVEVVLKIDKKDIGLKHFRDCKLTGMIRLVYNDSPYLAINDAYPNEILPWEMKWCPMHLWEDLSMKKKAFNWLLEEENITKEQVTATMFRDNGLTGLIDRYNGRLYDLIEELAD
ncbi:MAG: DUF4046 domain-containing protein [Paraclostridium sp.]